MRLFIHGNSCEYSCCACSGRENFDSTTDDVYSIDVPDFIKISTLSYIIKDKENMTEHNFQAMRLLCNGVCIYPSPMTPMQCPSMCDQPRSRSVVEQLWEKYRLLSRGKLNEIPNLNDESHIHITFRMRG